MSNQGGTVAASPLSDGNRFIIVHSGWLDKEIVHGYIVFAKYSPRFVVLTSTFIRYYHKAISAAEMAEQDVIHQQTVHNKGKKVPLYVEVPLSSLSEQALVAGAQNEPDIVHIEHTGTGKMYRFRASTQEEALRWRMILMTTKGKLNPSVKVHFQTMDNKADDGPSEQQILSIASKWCDHDDLLFRFEQVAFSNVDRAKYVADSFFDSLSQLTSKDRSMRAKEMGKSLIAWLDQDPTKTAEEKVNSLKADILIVWLRVALSREFLNSCKFDESGGANDDGDASSESSSMTHSTIKSRMRNAKKGSIIMPFRADTGECLFISAIFHSSCAKSNTLHFILHPVLRCISNNAENYIYPKATLVAPPVSLIPEIPPEESTANPSSLAEKSNNRNSLSRRSRNFFGMVRNTMRFNHLTGNSATTKGRSNSKDSNGESPGSRPQSLDGRALSSAANNFYNNADARREQEAQRLALAELALLSPMELKRLEVRNRLLEVAASLAERLQECSVSSYLPLPIALMIKTMKDLIITDKEASARNSFDGDIPMSTSNSDIASEDESETSKNKRRFEYGTFFTSCSALLFLRLICRAIISPDDYGVTEKLNPTIFERIANKDAFQWPNSGFPAMTVLAHTLFSGDVERRTIKEEATLAIYSKKEHMNTAEVEQLHQMSIELKNKVSMNDVTIYLELYHWKKTSSLTAQRNSLNLRNLQLGGGKSEDATPYQFDWSKQSTRWALAEVAKAVQHIANISCLPKDEMQAFARDSLLRQNIAAGFLDKDAYDTHVFTGLETETITSQIAVASRIKEIYEKLGDLPPGKW